MRDHGVISVLGPITIRVEVLGPYQSLRDLGQDNSIPIEALVDRLKAMGVVAIAMSEHKEEVSDMRSGMSKRQDAVFVGVVAVPQR